MAGDLKDKDPLFSAAILKLTFMMKKMTDQPGFRVVYFGTLKDLGLTDRTVSDYIDAHREELEAHIAAHGRKD